MDVQLQELIDRIKSEGVKSAETASAKIIAEAEAKAKVILEKAREEAARIVETGRRESAQFERSAKDAVAQAGRDLVLGLDREVRTAFEGLTAAAVKEAYSAKVLEEAIAALVKSWPDKQSDALEVLLSKQDLERVQAAMLGRLGETLKKGLTLKPVAGIEGGFRIGVKDGAVYFDFSSEGIADALSAFLNPRIAALLHPSREG